SQGDLKKGSAKISWKEDSNDSWSWKVLLNLRHKVRPHIRHVFGNGQNTSMWYDTWDADGPLSSIITRRDVYDARLKDNTIMAVMINNNCWSWPYGWCDRYPMLNNILVPLLKSNEDDKVYWVKGNRETTKFSVNNVWMDWRFNNSDVPWRNVVWFSQNNPRYAFILWVAIKERLLTQDKMMIWASYSR
ncbi:RNA-directed DNA polymerase, eukaryota, reverse transcriptase zinc-binding domain protein, partial [Tanacetum coccineum]